MSCRHCGDPCATAAVVTDLGSFCCSGCEAVFSLLQSSGLGAFYACEVPPGVSQRGTTDGDRSAYAALDDAAIRSRFVEFDDGHVARAAFSVPALHCASCVWLIERLWRLDPAIIRADVDLMRRSVRVTFRSTDVTLRQVAERLAAVGYAPLLDDEQKQAGMPPARRSLYLKLGVAGFAFGNTMLFSVPRYAHGAMLDQGFQRVFDVLNLALALPVLVYSASDYFRSAWHSLRERVASLDLPVAIGLTALFLRSVVDIASQRGEGFTDSFTGLVFFLLIGRLFQQKAFDAIAFDRSFRSFLPLSVRVERADGTIDAVPLDAIEPGDLIVVRPREIVPADALLLDASGAVDYAFITGEERPVPVACGETVRAGGRVDGTTLRLRVERAVSHSRLAGLWNNPAFAKVKAHWLADLSGRAGAWFTVAAVGLAVAGAIAWWPDGRRALDVATAVLIVACPCALALSAPITLGTAMSVLGRRGFYLKHPAVALDLSRVDTIAFDKTGTLTASDGVPDVDVEGLDEAAWALVRRLASESLHPASRAIAAAGPVAGRVTAFAEVGGQGLSGRVDGHPVVIGTPGFVANAIGVPVPADDGAIVVAVDSRLAGRLRITAPARPGAEAAARRLGAGHDLLLLSGDHDREADRWRPIFGARMSFRQSPEDKLALVRARQGAGRHVLMIGDGLNDAGALGAADVGVAVSDDAACVVPACDAVVRGDRLHALPGVLAYARRARRVILAAVLISVAYNAVGVSFALAGALTPLATAILMPLSSITVIALGVGAMRWPAPAEVA